MSAELKTVEGHSVPLLGVQVDAEVVGGHTRVKVTQRYRNTEARAVEAIYTFPLPSDASVSGFVMVCGERRLEGLVQEREEAFRTYDDAIAHGHGAALLEQERKNVFTASVGNLLPNEDTLIEVEYLQRLTADEGALRWMLPTLVAPRYIPGTAQGNRTGGGWAEPTTAVPDADRITPKIGDVAYGLKLALTFDLGAEIEVESPSHKIVSTKRGDKVRVSFEQPEVALDRDVVVIARRAKGMLAGVAAHRDGDAPGYFSLTVVPDLFEAGKTAPMQEVLFVVDTSGSMEGESLPQAVSAMKLCLRHLREGDRFNIMEFNSSFTTFAKETVVFSQATLEKADRWLNGLHATGGTELLQPLKKAAEMVPAGVVILMTDGQVGDEAQILEQVLKVRRTMRISSFGIGTNVSDQLLRDLARHTGGAVEFIHPGERIDEKVTAQFAKIVAERITNVELKWVGVSPSDVAPGFLSALIDGEPWTVLGRYERAGRGHVEIFGRRGDAPFVLQVPVELPEREEQPALRPLWAEERIRDWEAASVSGRRANAMKERITQLAVEYRVSSPYTSFVVVEKREGSRLSPGQPEARFVPVSKPAGWDTFRNVGFDVMSAPAAAPMPQPMMRARASAASVLGAPVGALAGVARSVAHAFGGGGNAAPPPPPAAKKAAQPPAEMVCEEVESFTEPEPVDPVARLMEEQLASGLWDASSNEPEALRQAKATTRVLVTLLQHGVTSSHAVFGAQVRKAVEALVKLAATLSGEQPLVELALSAAWLVATGQRTRAAITTAAQAHPALLSRLGDEAKLRAEVAGAQI